MSVAIKSLRELTVNIDVEDLQYIENDLSFYQLSSLGFLLYGDDRAGREFILQRLIILSQNPPQGMGFQEPGQFANSNILRDYAKLNPQTWRLHLVEALAIIRAKRVIRKLGISWQEIYRQLLPHIAEISMYIHPLLKALYKICERLAPEQAGRLVYYVNEKHTDCQNLRFYDSSYLEIFLLNFLTKDVIDLGSQTLEHCNVQILIEFFKLNEMDLIKDILVETINQKLDKDNIVAEIGATACEDSGIDMAGENAKDAVEINADFDAAERYHITKENAGYVLIINQKQFYREKDPNLKHLLPKLALKCTRNGTDVDRDRLKELFSSRGYTPLVFNNLTHLEVLHQIRETVKKSLLKDSLIIFLLTHGMEGVVYGCNLIPVTIAEIKEILTDETLFGKPKMVFAAACQKHNPNTDTTSTNAIQNFRPDAYADILWASSAIKGTESLRHTATGTWFVESLCKYIEKYGNRKHMLDILTVVINDISTRKTDDDDEVMLPETQTTLRKELYLPS